MDASELYGLAPEGFTAARNELVKRLRAAGRREEASVVARLRKPPATAWALNQVARQSPDVVTAVFDAGGQLRAAMDAALGGDASLVRAARAAEREAVGAAVAAAGRHLEGAGHPATDAARRRIEATLRAAMVDDSVASRLGQGVLDSDHDAPGFGFEGTAPFVEDKFVEDKFVEDKAAPDTKQQETKRQQAQRRADAEQQAALRARLVDEADRLAGRAEELEAAAQDAEVRARRARQAADEATDKAIEARARAEEVEVPGD